MINKLLNILGIIAVYVAVFFAISITKGKVMQVGIKTENMDLNVKAGKDFYDFATKGWRNANPIPDDYTRYGSFDMLIEENNKRVREIVEKDNGKIGLLYKIAMNEEKLNSEKTNPVKPYLDEVNAIKSKEDLPKYLGRAHRFTIEDRKSVV